MLILPRRKAGGIPVDEVFSTDLFTASSSDVVVNGLDNTGEGGLAWFKRRNGAVTHALYDTARGAAFLETPGTNSESAFSMVTFAGDGYTSNTAALYGSGTSIVCWNFRRADKFFDFVTYTGDGTSGRPIAHSLGATPGMVVVKRRNATSQWTVRHRSASGELVLNTDAIQTGSHGRITAVSDSTFTVSSDASVNASGGTYIAYVLGHDTSPSGNIQCGSYTGNGSATGPAVDLGWEPQWVLIKSSTAAWGWVMLDSARDTSNPREVRLYAHTTAAEASSTAHSTDFTSSGFQIKTTGSDVNLSGQTYVYAAIRAEGT